VLVSDHKEGRTPLLEKVIDDVTYDSQQAASRLQTKNTIKGIVLTYNVIVDF